MTETILEIKNLYAGTADKEIIKNLNLTVKSGEIHAIMGPNGAGKSTLSYVLTGKKDYQIFSGDIIFKGKNLKEMSIEDRSNAGIFLSMQSPTSIPGVTFNNFLRHAVNSQRKYNGLPELDMAAFLKLLREEARNLKIESELLKRELNVGFSGGEKKRMEVLQMSLLKPTLSILDEMDSGLDIDALRIVSQGVNSLHNSQNALLIITHHLDLLNHITPDFVHIYADGHIVRSGNKKLAEELEQKGYSEFLQGE